MNKISKKVVISKSANLKNSIIKKYVFIKDNTIIENSKIDKYSIITRNSMVIRTNIGKFCSIANDVSIGLWEHDINKISTHPFYLYEHNGEFVSGYKDYEKEFLVTEIGNDVWIGAHSVILKGIKIGTGAVIGAGSIVTKDVPPYAIVVGNPAKILKFRYSLDEIDFLQATKWWNFKRKKLKNMIQVSAFENFENFKRYIVKYNI